MSKYKNLKIRFDPEWEHSAFDVVMELMKEGVLAKQTQYHTIRFSPPLVITKEDVDIVLGKIYTVISKLIKAEE